MDNEEKEVTIDEISKGDIVISKPRRKNCSRWGDNIRYSSFR